MGNSVGINGFSILDTDDAGDVHIDRQVVGEGPKLPLTPTDKATKLGPKKQKVGKGLVNVNIDTVPRKTQNEKYYASDA